MFTQREFITLIKKDVGLTAEPVPERVSNSPISDIDMTKYAQKTWADLKKDEHKYAQSIASFYTKFNIDWSEIFNWGKKVLDEKMEYGAIAYLTGEKLELKANLIASAKSETIEEIDIYGKKHHPTEGKEVEKLSNIPHHIFIHTHLGTGGGMLPSTADLSLAIWSTVVGKNTGCVVLSKDCLTYISLDPIVRNRLIKEENFDLAVSQYILYIISFYGGVETRLTFKRRLDILSEMGLRLIFYGTTSNFTWLYNFGRRDHGTKFTHSLLHLNYARLVHNLQLSK